MNFLNEETVPSPTRIDPHDTSTTPSKDEVFPSIPRSGRDTLKTAFHSLPIIRKRICQLGLQN